jgi:hypothetical protein
MDPGVVIGGVSSLYFFIWLVAVLVALWRTRWHWTGRHLGRAILLSFVIMALFAAATIAAILAGPHCSSNDYNTLRPLRVCQAILPTQVSHGLA